MTNTESRLNAALALATAIDSEGGTSEVDNTTDVDYIEWLTSWGFKGECHED